MIFMSGKILIAGIAFLLVGLIFFVAAVSLKYGKSFKEISIAKPSSVIFYIIGAVTFVLGILILVFKKEFSKSAFELLIFGYLIFIAFAFCLFTFLLKKGNSDESKHS